MCLAGGGRGLAVSWNSRGPVPLLRELELVSPETASVLALCPPLPQGMTDPRQLTLTCRSFTLATRHLHPLRSSPPDYHRSPPSYPPTPRLIAITVVQSTKSCQILHRRTTGHTTLPRRFLLLRHEYNAPRPRLRGTRVIPVSRCSDHLSFSNCQTHGRHSRGQQRRGQDGVRRAFQERPADGEAVWP